MQILKYVCTTSLTATARRSTFMPKPLVGDNGSGMHVHQSLAKGGKNLFAGDGYGGAVADVRCTTSAASSKHAKALNAFTNPSTNSYKRLVPGFEAPRHAGLLGAEPPRVDPYSLGFESRRARRIEVRFPDSLRIRISRFASMMMAGTRRHPEQDSSGRGIGQGSVRPAAGGSGKHSEVCHSLDMALDHLDRDRDFLKRGGVFTTT